MEHVGWRRSSAARLCADSRSHLQRLCSAAKAGNALIRTLGVSTRGGRCSIQRKQPKISRSWVQRGLLDRVFSILLDGYLHKLKSRQREPTVHQHSFARAELGVHLGNMFVGMMPPFKSTLVQLLSPFALSERCKSQGRITHRLCLDSRSPLQRWAHHPQELPLKLNLLLWKGCVGVRTWTQILVSNGGLPGLVGMDSYSSGLFLCCLHQLHSLLSARASGPQSFSCKN